MDTRVPGSREAPNEGSHCPYTAHSASRLQRPGLRKAGTVRANSDEVKALAYARAQLGIACATIARLIEVSPSIVQDWFTGLRPIQWEKLEKKCPRLYAAAQARLAMIRGEESVA
jgi:hypothetical protein